MRTTETLHRVGSKSDENIGKEMEAVFSRCMPSFYRVAFCHLRNQADAEDAVQDALLSAYKHRDQFRGQAQMSTWITTIVVNSARMQLRRRSRQRHVSLNDEPAESNFSLSDRLSDQRPNPEQECRASEFEDRAMHLIVGLSAPLRQAFQLRELEGLSMCEMAVRLGVSEGTAKARLFRARKKLRYLARRRLGHQMKTPQVEP